jgi:3-oxoadipate enol-lactonase / 4-carboxymuconolactone decarboxylase
MIPDFTIEGAEAGPVLVLLNSLGTTAELWTPQLHALHSFFRIVRPEHRGHGGGHAPPGPYSIGELASDIVDLLDHLGVEEASLCGVSLGGMVAMWFAAHHADRVDRVLLACTAPALPPASAWKERAAAVRAGGVDQLLPVLLERWFADPTTAPSDVVASMLSRTDPEGYAGCCDAIADMDLRPDLAAIKAPTLVVGGAADPVVPPAMAVALQEAIPGSALTILPRAGHLANLEQPAAFTRVMLAHLRGDAFDLGHQMRSAVLGPQHVAGSTERDPEFIDFITRYAWGEVWTRPGLDRATRSRITIAMLVAQSRWDELPLHLRGAVRNGVTREEIKEILLQAAIYCGVPAANTAFAIAERELA